MKATSVAIDSIQIPPKRLRCLGDVSGLAESIGLVGLLHPIMLREDNLLLVAGLHRLEACRSLGWSEIPANLVDPKFARLIEIDENLARHDLSALDRAEHLAERQAIYLELFPETKGGVAGGKARQGSATDIMSFAEATTKSAGLTERSIRRDIRLANNLSPEVKTLLRGTSTADSQVDLLNLSRLSHSEQRAVAGKLVDGEAKSTKQALSQLRTEALAEKAAASTQQSAIVLTGDAVQLIAQLSSIHCIVMDPPYGLEEHHSNFDYKGKDYADGPEYALQLLKETCAALVSRLAADAHLYVFSGYTHSHAFKQILAQFFDVQDNPLIWKKSTHAPCDFSKRYPNSHEYIWFAKVRGGNRPLAGCVRDVLDCPPERATDHSAEKPTALLQTLIEQSTVPGEHVVDPFCGSGSTGVAALRTNRRFTGIELDPHWVAVAKGRIQ